MKIHIREGVREDIPRLVALEKECFSSPWSEKGFADFFDSPYSVALVAECDGVVCGYVGMYLIAGEGEVTNLAVSGGYRRHGIGLMLMTALADTKGLTRLMLDVRESNTAARSLYEKSGFKIDGKRKNFYEKPREDAVLMSLDINEGHKNADTCH